MSLITLFAELGKFVDRERWPSVAFAFTLDRFGPLFAVDELQVVDCFQTVLGVCITGTSKELARFVYDAPPSSLIMRPSKSLRKQGERIWPQQHAFSPPGT